MTRASIPAALAMAIALSGAAVGQTPDLSPAKGPGAADRFVFVAGGDMIGPFHPLDRSDPGFAAVAALFQGADLGFANAEGSIFDLADFAGYPAAETGGGYPVQTPRAAQDIRAMGIGVVSKANNHATDWGAEGLVASLQALAAAGVAEAGAGLGEDAARSPAYVATGKGVAALVDTASTFPPMAVAGPPVTRQGVTSRPRPGISALHVREVRLVTAHQLASLRRAMGEDPSAAPTFRIGDQVFEAASRPGARWEMDPGDERAILARVGEARARASFVIFSIHAHETAGDEDVPGPAAFEPMVLHRADEAASPDDPRPAAFEPALFHAAIDAGADVVVRTGPHVLGGVEIYRGKPIFYGLGSLFFDFGGRRTLTSPGGETMTFPDALFDAVVPVCVFARGRLTEIRLHPITIEAGPGPRSGVPRPADADHAARILKRLASLSAAFGTRVDIEAGTGVIRIP
jgi:poly-gamma-glutamate synthesis protein (capsule biosynthesis protein)